MSDDLYQLPDPEMRTRLILGLGNVARRAGWERLVTQPILLPQAEFFPDRWNRSARGAYRVARRLLVYAGLGDRDVRLEVFQNGPFEAFVAADGSSYPNGPEGAAATFAGTSAEAHHFGVNVRYLVDDELLVAAMCHEVAHAFRAAHGLVVTKHEMEEQLTDVTTIYLGFGVLATNGTCRFRTTGGLYAGYATLGSQQNRLGYLSPSEMSFLLAAHVVARRTRRAEVQRILANLEANQRALFEEAIDELESNRAELDELLEIPPEERWPKKPALTQFLTPLDAGREEDYDDLPPRAVKDLPVTNTHTTVFRVRQGRTGLGMIAGGLLGLVAVQNLGPSLGWPLFAVAIFFLGGIGKRWYHYQCSDPNCEQSVDRLTAECPRCKGTFGGTIASAGDRLAAAEALEQGTFVSLE